MAAKDTQYTQVHLLEKRKPRKRLGRHVLHDERSRNFRAVGPRGVVRQSAPIGSATHTIPGGVLDQGNLGSCTGNATAYLARFYQGSATGLGERTAVKIYELASRLDGVPGAYPPNDTGSDGLSALKAALELRHLPRGAKYRWCFGLDDVLRVVSNHGPVIIGISWYSGMDSPDRNGLVKPTGTVRGGHEVCVYGLEWSGKPTTSYVNVMQSWGSSWGLHGRFRLRVPDLGKLLKHDGDAACIAP